eukprot:scaffold741_cov336-Pavlova_lutheri.AAC.37
MDPSSPSPERLKSSSRNKRMGEEEGGDTSKTAFPATADPEGSGRDKKRSTDEIRAMPVEEREHLLDNTCDPVRSDRGVVPSPSSIKGMTRRKACRRIDRAAIHSQPNQRKDTVGNDFEYRRRLSDDENGDLHCGARGERTQEHSSFVHVASRFRGPCAHYSPAPRGSKAASHCKFRG